MDKSHLLDKVKKDFMEIWDKPGKMGRISVTQKTEGGGYRRHSREGETLEQWYEDWEVYQDDKSLLFNWDVEYKLGRGWDVQFSRSVIPTLWDPRDCSMPDFPVHYQLTEFTQTYVHWVGDAIQPSHPVSSPSLSAFNLSQHQGVLQGVSSSHQVAEGLAFQPQHQSFQRTPRIDFL